MAQGLRNKLLGTSRNTEQQQQQLQTLNHRGQPSLLFGQQEPGKRNGSQRSPLRSVDRQRSKQTRPNTSPPAQYTQTGGGYTSGTELAVVDPDPAAKGGRQEVVAGGGSLSSELKPTVYAWNQRRRNGGRP